MIIPNPHSPNDLAQALTDLWDAETEHRHDIAARTGLTPHDHQALEYIVAAAHTGSAASSKSLAAEVGLTPASITLLIDRLERRGLITRAVNPTDQRALILRPTSEGSELIDAARSAGVDFDVELSGMTESEREAGTRFLTTLAAAIRHPQHQ